MLRLAILGFFFLYFPFILAKADKKPQRIVTTFVGADVIVYELLRGEPERLLAVSPLGLDKAYSPIYNELSQNVKTFGWELESLLLLKPDLVIAAKYTRAEWLAMLGQAKVNTLKLENFSSLADIKENILKIGQAIQRLPQAQAIVAVMDKKLLSLQKNCPLKGKKILNYNPEGTLFGKGTTFDDLFTHVGVRNLAGELGIKGWSQVPREQLASMMPDYVVATGEESHRIKLLGKLRSSLGWKQLPAIKRGQLILIPGRFLSSVTHWSLRALEIACGQI